MGVVRNNHDRPRHNLADKIVQLYYLVTIANLKVPLPENRLILMLQIHLTTVAFAARGLADMKLFFASQVMTSAFYGAIVTECLSLRVLLSYDTTGGLANTNENTCHLLVL